jgi:uncharacterized OB-fold protein
VSLSPHIVLAEPSTVVATGTGTEIARRGASFDDGAVVLVGSACTACDAVAWPPAARCHACWAAVTPRRLATSGTLYAFTTVHTAAPGTEVPYVIGYVDLPDGVRVFTPLRGDTSLLQIDGPVTLHGSAGAPGAGFWFEAAR